MAGEIYDRSLLLAGPKRSTVLDLWEVERYGRDSYGDGDYVSIYGMRPEDWYRRGVRVLGRTAVECTRDCLGARIAERLKDLVFLAVSRAASCAEFVGTSRWLP